ncbi:glycosyltransferase family protein [Nocardia otitidiscaviarum]|uniref:glycosyltransferase family protein n=1 Tax=Nocardia otitidiscaviarum TaxID=1823 RepID=UPI0004A71D38|nr:glycosyltransferase [Nocardia otitidiscaviarum]
MKIAFLGNFRVSYTSETHHAATLEALGHDVIRLQEAAAPALDILATAIECDLFVWVHTHGWHTDGIERVLGALKAAGVPTMTYHLDLWLGLRREQDMHTDPYWQVGHFFTADRLMAEWLTTNTPVRGHYLPAGVYDRECYLAAPGARFDVAFVGSRKYHPEWPYRPQLIDWLRATYGGQFRHYGNGGLGIVRGPELNQVYADAKIVVGDSLCLNYRYPDYWSDRVYETLGRGGFLIHPRVPGMDEHFEDRKHLVFYDFGDFDQLRALIGHYLTHDEEREAIRSTGHEHVKANHTYVHRWSTILETFA